ncbi:MAG: sel1 repeat family protein, partial [Proteobacteria bacterium]|nr:sel1 repeat family protein [Pseudomonadota bacterium]
MKNVIRSIYLILAVFFGTAGVGHAADFDNGIAAFDKGDFAGALVQWEPLAKKGDADAQFNVGLLYEQGKGVPVDGSTKAMDYEIAAQNYVTAMKWYTLAAAQGHVFAQTNLGAMYDRGAGVLENDKIAVKWYTLAAKQGFAVAQSNLGAMYDNGEGVEQDYKSGAKWYTLAAEQGYAQAQTQLGAMYYNGQGVSQD